MDQLATIQALEEENKKLKKQLSEILASDNHTLIGENPFRTIYKCSVDYGHDIVTTAIEVMPLPNNCAILKYDGAMIEITKCEVIDNDDGTVRIQISR